MTKAKSQPVDGLLFDLEDAVPVSQKDDARAIAARMVVPDAYGHREAVIRVNGFGTPWFDRDVDMAAASACHAILVPKAEDPELLLALSERVGADKDIWCMIESPLGVLNASAIAQVPGVKCLVSGTEDLKQFLRCAPQLPDRPQLQVALQTTVLAARAAGIAALDGVYPLLSDLAGFERECQQVCVCGCRFVVLYIV
jgi:citrate lyase beta subunit